MHRAAPALTRTHTLSSDRPGQGPLSASPSGLWSPVFRRPRLGAGPRTPAEGSEQRLPWLPGSAAARGGAEAVEEGGRRRGRQAAARLPLPLSARRSAPPGAQSAAAASHAARAGAGCGGGDRRVRGLVVIPLHTDPQSRGRSNPGSSNQRNRVGGYKNLRPLRFSGPSPPYPPPPSPHTPHGYSCVLKELPRRNLIVTEFVVY